MDSKHRAAALRLNLPQTENAFEVRTPIGSKLVFEKWSDGSDGLYRLADLDARMASAIGEYDAIEDAPSH